MKTKHSSSNLYLYTFLGLLMALAALVDVGSLSSKAMANQNDRTEKALKHWDL
ncbi:hypothetical protein [Stenotrophomonas maltophilia]|uniref:hypothetical protein n=1 Tax=Stenotrophomonas maltophilia TaxID=40324 RepID=UPI0015EC77A4|nr:hypothetical protein [Stenotrophomonas maltophilia]